MEVKPEEFQKERTNVFVGWRRIHLFTIDYDSVSGDVCDMRNHVDVSPASCQYNMALI